MPDRFRNLINHQKKGAMKRFFVKFGRALNWNLTPFITFVAFKRWLAAQRDREALKRRRDGLQADAVQRLVDEYLP